MPNIEINQASFSHVDSTSLPATQIAQATSGLEAVEAKLGFGDALGADERRRIYSGSYNLPNATIEAVAAIAARNGGVVAGVNVDPAALLAALAFEQSVEPLAVASERVARRARDAVLRKRHEAVIKTEVAIAALERLGRLDGHALNSDLKAVKATIPRRRRAKKAAAPVLAPVATPK